MPSVSSSQSHSSIGAISSIFGGATFLQNLFLPDAPMINVKNPPYNAKGDGVTDDTAALQAAINDAGGITPGTGQPRNLSIVFIPHGTYLVSNTLSTQYQRCVIQGESRDGTAIKLADSASGYQNASSPKPVLAMGGSNNSGHTVHLSDITIWNGSNTPGAVLLSFTGHNKASIRRVRLVGTNSVVGLALGGFHAPDSPGPLLVSDVIVDGTFTHCIYVDGNGEYNVVFTNLFTRGGTGIRALDVGLQVQFWEHQGSGQALVQTAGIHSAVYIGNLSHGGASSINGPALIQADTTSGSPCVYLLACTKSSTAFPMVSVNGAIPYPASTNTVSNYRIHDTGGGTYPVTIQTSNSTGPDSALFAIQRDSEWQVETAAADYVGANRSMSGIQTALNAGKKVVYIKKGAGSIATSTSVPTLTVPVGVQCIDFMYADITGTPPVVLSVTSGTSADPPLHIRNLNFASVTLSIGCTRKVYLHDLYLKQIYMNTGTLRAFDVSCDNVNFEGGHIIAMQLNCEGTGSNPFVRAYGVNTNVCVVGLKTEKPCPAVVSDGGAKMDIKGAFLYPVTASTDSIWLGVCNDSQLTMEAVWIKGSAAGPTDYKNVITEGRSGNWQAWVYTRPPTAGNRCWSLITARSV